MSMETTVDVEIYDDEIASYLRKQTGEKREQFAAIFTSQTDRDFFQQLKLLAHNHDAVGFVRKIEDQAAACGVLMDLRALGIQSARAA